MYNINPVLWGKHGWTFLHYITLSYPDNPDEATKQMFKEFFTQIIWKVVPLTQFLFHLVTMIPIPFGTHKKWKE